MDLTPFSQFAGTALPHAVDRHGYRWLNMAMNKVKVGELRNHLSKYLKKVQEGREIVITDRDRPIGRIVPYLGEFDKDEELKVIEPPGGYEGFSKLQFAPIDCAVDPVEILIADRRKR